MSEVLQNAPREHSAILSICIKLPFVFFRHLFFLFLSGRLRQVNCTLFPDKMIVNEALAGAPLLLLANKQDLQVLLS